MKELLSSQIFWLNTGLVINDVAKKTGCVHGCKGCRCRVTVAGCIPCW